MDLKNLSYFIKVAETEHLSRSAKSLHIAQPALSKIISNLESDLQVKLFDRVGKKIHLNDNGRIFLRYAKMAINAIADARTEIADCNLQQSNTVVIAMHAASKLLPEIIAGFNQKNPGIKIAIVQHEESSWENRHCDLIVDSSQNRLVDSQACLLLEEDILLAVPASHPLAAKDEINLEEAANESFISLQKGKGLSNLTIAYCLAAGFEPGIILESDDPAVVRSLIGLGLGVAFIPAITWQGAVDSRMKLLRIKNIACHRYLYVFWNESRYFSRPTQLLRDYLIGFFDFNDLPAFSAFNLR